MLIETVSSSSPSPLRPMNWPRVEDGEVRVSIDPDIAGWYSSLGIPHEPVYCLTFDLCKEPANQVLSRK